MQVEIYNSLDGQTPYDITMVVYADPSLVVRLCSDNNLPLDQTVTSGTPILFYPALRKRVPSNISSVITVPATYGKKTGIERQTIYDICLLTYGKMENVVSLCKENGIESLNDISAKGVDFKYELNRINDIKLYLYLQRLGTGVGATLDVPDAIPVVVPRYRLLEDGSYRLLEDDFKRLLQ